MSRSRSALRALESSVIASKPTFESLEGRRLYSTTPVLAEHVIGAGSSFDMSAPLGTFAVKSKTSASGNVGAGVSETLYSFDVSEPITLKVKLSKLKQNDGVSILFSDGTLIAKTSNGTASSLSLNQRLDPGHYLLDVSNGTGSSRSSHRKGGSSTAFKLSMKAGKSDGSVAPVAPQHLPGGSVSPTAGFGDEPIVTATQFAQWVNESNQPLFGPGGPSADDIKQGINGDCYFLATLSDIARSDPGLIQDHIEDLGNGTFRVRFERNGQDVFETVDAQLPADANGNLIYAKLGDGGASWVAIMEKAWTYFRHPERAASYDEIAFGWSEEVFPAVGADNVAAVSQQQLYTGGDLTQQISDLQAQGRVVTLATQQSATTLVASHMYSVVGVNGDGTIQLRNPWGSNPNSYGDGGYISIAADQALSDMSEICSATTPHVTPNPQPNPNPEPNPEPTPDPTPTPNPEPTPDPEPTPEPTPDPTPTPTDDLPISGELGGYSTFVLSDGTYADAYVVTANFSGYSSVLGMSSDFNTYVSVLQLNGDGTATQVATASDFDGNGAAANFYAEGGTQYEIVVMRADGYAYSGGNYTLYLANGLTNAYQLSPSDFGG
jgi:hypothetical protein